MTTFDSTAPRPREAGKRPRTQFFERRSPNRSVCAPNADARHTGEVKLGSSVTKDRGAPASLMNHLRLPEIEALLRDRRRRSTVDIETEEAFLTVAAPHLGHIAAAERDLAQDAATRLRCAVTETERTAARADLYRARRGETRVADWIRRWCPKLAAARGSDWITRFAAAASSMRFVKAQMAGDLLRLTEDERRRLGITTIRPAGWTEDDYTKHRRSTKSASAKRSREGKGATPRELSVTALKPWEAEGIGKTKWYATHSSEEQEAIVERLREQVRGQQTTPKRLCFSYLAVHEPVHREKGTRNEADGSVPVGDGSALERSPAPLTEAAEAGGREARGAPRPRKRTPNPVPDQALVRPPLGPISSRVLDHLHPLDVGVTARVGASGARPDGRGVLVLAPENRIELPEPVPIWPPIASRNGAAGGRDAQR